MPSASLSLNSYFNFTHAICRGIPNSLKDEALRMEKEDEPIDLEVARKNYEIYKSSLESCGVKVIYLEADESYPDCVFVEDTCIVIGNTAFITRPGHPSRRDEVGILFNLTQSCQKRNSPTLRAAVFLFNFFNACILSAFFFRST